MSYTVFRMLPSTEQIGKIKTNGDMYSMSGEFLGSISVEGKIRNPSGKLLGIVNRSGTFSSKIYDTQKFKVAKKGQIIENGLIVGAVKQEEKGLPEKFAQWIACIFFFHKEKVQEPTAIKEVREQPPVQKESATQGVASIIDTVQQEAVPLEMVEQFIVTPEPEPEPTVEPVAPEIVVEAPTIEEPEIKPIPAAITKTVRMPSLESMENYASLRMQAFMEKKKRESEKNSGFDF